MAASPKYSNRSLSSRASGCSLTNERCVRARRNKLKSSKGSSAFRAGSNMIGLFLEVNLGDAVNSGGSEFPAFHQFLCSLGLGEPTRQPGISTPRPPCLVVHTGQIGMLLPTRADSSPR